MKFHNVRDNNGRFAPKSGKPLGAKPAKKKSKKNNNCYVGLVLDESSSMDCVKEATQNGYNEYIDSLIKSNKGLTTNVSLVRFSCSHKVRAIYTNFPLCTDLKINDYNPYGQTALYDAIGLMIRTIENQYKKGDSVILSIYTDGQNNDSIKYTQNQIHELIETKKKEGWMINYIGMGEDIVVKKAASSIGIFSSNTLSYASNTNANIGITMDSLSTASTSYRKAFADTGETSNVGFFVDED